MKRSNPSVLKRQGRLKLDQFQAKTPKLDTLLGQVLGDCHDDRKYDSKGTIGGWMDD